MAEGSTIYQDGFRAKINEADLEILKNNSVLIAELKEVIAKINDWSHDGIKLAINDFAAAYSAS